MGLVGIHAPVALGQVILELDGGGVLLHKVAVGVPLAELADADVYHAERAGKGQHHCRHPTGKGLAPPPAAAEQEQENRNLRRTSVQVGSLIKLKLQNLIIIPANRFYYPVS